MTLAIDKIIRAHNVISSIKIKLDTFSVHFTSDIDTYD